MANLPITNVINISAATVQAGVNAFNTANLALFTDDQPQAAITTLTFSGVAASGNFVLNFNGVATSSIAWNATIATITADIIAVTGMTNVAVTGTIATSLVISQPGTLGPILTCTVTSNTLQTAGSVAIVVTPTVTNAGWSGGAAGFAQYLSPTQVGVDFGTSSKTAILANSIFAQQPNMLNANGELIIIPFATAKQTLTFSAAPASGSFAVTYNSNTSGLIQWNASPTAIQTALQAVAGLSQVQVTGSISGTVLTIWMFGIYGTALALGTTTNTLNASITITDAVVTAGESWTTALTRTNGLVSYCGAMVNELADTIGQTDVLAAAANIQALNNAQIGFVVSNNSSDTAPGGMLDLIRSAADNNMRALYYGDSTTVSGIAGYNAFLYMGAYAGLALSTNFSGSNTTQTMHLKTLVTVPADPTMTQTLLNQAVAAGADTYPSLQGVAKVFCSGTNSYFDSVFNLCWFVQALQVAGFNYLAQSNTKIPQTEAGMDGLKTAYRGVCEQGVANQYLAPGKWTSSTTFGVQQDFLNNILQRGYYIYSSPVALQSAANRAARQAPLCQIAAKQAGAIQSSSVIVFINA
jgi:hypothetical protein